MTLGVTAAPTVNVFRTMMNAALDERTAFSSSHLYLC